MDLLFNVFYKIYKNWTKIFFLYIDDLSKITDINVNGCECINYDCGCCQYMELDFMSLNGNCE